METYTPLKNIYAAQGFAQHYYLRVMTGHSRFRSGFTLIELAIVLVVIGLIVGGILVGRDLIKAAEVRQLITNFDMFGTAVNTFRLKYNCLPGDCTSTNQIFADIPPKAAAYIDSTHCPGGNGNGDGYINVMPSWGNCTVNPQCFCEPVLANYSLEASQLLPGYFKLLHSSPRFYQGLFSSPMDVVEVIQGDVYYGNVWPEFQQLPENLLVASSFCGGPYGCATASPNQLQAVDAKIDDGLPQNGKFIAQPANARLTNNAYVPGTCISASAPYSYVLSDAVTCRVLYYLK